MIIFFQKRSYFNDSIYYFSHDYIQTIFGLISLFITFILQGLPVQPKGSNFRSDRLQIVKLIVLLVQCYSVDINKELVRLRTLEVLWKLFLQHPFNNFLHTQVGIISSVFDASLTDYKL